MRLAYGDSDRPSLTHSSTARFDANGRFQIADIVPGASYTLRAASRVLDVPYGMRPVSGLFDEAKMGPRQFEPFELARNLAAEPGQVVDLGTFNAATGKPIKALEKQAAVEAKDVPITGRIVDLEGRPIAGVTVQVTQVTKAKGDDLTPWLEGVLQGEPPWTVYKHLDREPNETLREKKLLEAATDQQGRFRIEGLGAEKVVDLSIEGPTIAYSMMNVITRRIDPIAAKGFSSRYGGGTQMVYGAEFTHTAAPGRPVVGVVRDAKNHEPMAGVEVRSYRFAGSHWVGTKDLKTSTDEAGRFRLVGLPKGRGNTLSLIPNDDQPYFMRESPCLTHRESLPLRYRSSSIEGSGSPARSPTRRPVNLSRKECCTTSPFWKTRSLRIPPSSSRMETRTRSRSRTVT